MKEELLRLLREANDCVSGQEICDMFGVSRTAVWKWINRLKEEGYVIEAIPRKGYRLLETPDHMTKQEIEPFLTTKTMGRNLVYIEEIDSTNEELKRLALEGAEHGTVVTADLQTKGKGRRGRTWISPGKDNIYLSLLLRPEMEIQYASMLTLVAALSVAEAVEDVTKEHVKIKWPNDIVFHNKKICGILTEMSAEMEGIHYILVGIGINVNEESFSDDIKEMATSIRKETGIKYQRAEIAAGVLNHFEKNYEIFMQNMNLSEFLSEYNERLINIGREVKILRYGREEQKISKGIDQEGALIVSDENGQEEKIISGEVSVRGLYGYV